MNNNDNDIYQAPDAELAHFENDHFAEHFKRFTAWGVFGLSIITLGIYPVYWLYNRSKVLNRFHDNKMPDWLLNVFLLTVVLSFVLGFMSGFYPDNALYQQLAGLMNIPYLVFYLMVLFKLKNRLVEASGMEMSGILTFFLNAIYLQYKLNEAIDQQQEVVA